MLSFIIYIIIILILIFVTIIAVKAIFRGLQAKKNLNKNYDINKKKRDGKD